MKLLTRWMTIAWAILSMTAWMHAASYTVTVVPGWNLLVNQLEVVKGNNIRSVLLKPPIGSQVRRFNLATKSFDAIETYQQLLTGAQTWVPGTTSLDPGDGFYFFNPNPRNIVLTFSGEPRVPKLPIDPGTGLVLVGRQLNDVAKVEDILGFTPKGLTAVYRFNPASGRDPDVFDAVNYSVFAGKGGDWFVPPGAPPLFNVGESIWITTSGSLPTIERQPTSQAICPGSKVGFSVAAFGTPPLAYQWFLEGKPIPNATGPSYSLPAATVANQGVYTVQVTNPFGNVTSNPVKLTVEDNTPPILTCPSNIVTSCRGVGGTLVSFVLGITDNCDPKAIVTSVPPSGSLFPGGITPVVVTGVDASGNKSTCTFTVTVVDDIRPQIICPTSITALATDPKGANVFYTVAVSDNCDTAPKVDCTPPSGSLFPVGDTLVTCVAKDSSGNSEICRFTVTVLDQSCCKGKSWGIADVTSPGPRDGHSMAYDSARGRVVLFGGETQGGIKGDTWEWDGSAWTQIPSEGPVPRAHAAMSYDSRIQRVVLYGGRNALAGVLDDTWFWDGAKWQLVAQKSTGGRYNHAMAYDSVRSVTVLHGGTLGDGVELDDTWEFDGKSWVKVFAGNNGPGPRQGHAMAYGSAQRQLLLFGGETKGEPNSETWRWDGKVWKLLTKEGPSARSFAAMAYSDNCDSVVLFGGGAKNVFTLADTWEWDGKVWSETATVKMNGRGELAMAHDSQHNQTVLLGGTRTLKDWLGDTWLLGLNQAAPQVVSVDAVCGETLIAVTFDHAVSASSSQNAANYQITCGQTLNAVLQATLTDDPRIVWLTLAQPISGACRLTISGVKDGCGRVIKTFQTGIECRQEPCQRGSAGLEYWLTFPGNYDLDPTNQPLPQLHIAGTIGTIGTVAMPGLAVPFSAPFTIPASGISLVDLPRVADLGNVVDTVQSNAVHVVASRPVSIYGLNQVPFSTDGYLGLSTRALGQTYFVMAYGNLFTETPELNGSQFAIAAATDNTTATIVPSTPVGSHTAGVPFVVTLMKGQTYQLRSTNGFPSDLSGTLVTADHPIAVFAGHRSATVPNTNVFFADHLVEQLPPTDTWGTNFLTLPFATRQNGDLFRVMAVIDGTTVRTNGSPVSGPINRGKIVEFSLAVAAQITSDKPVLLAQYANSSDFDSVLNADPFVVIVPPVAFYSSSYTIPSPSTNFPANYLNLTVPKAALALVVVDGVTLSPTLFSPIGSSGYFGARYPVNVGAHQVSAGGNGIGVIGYGWSLYNAYGFPGQTCAKVQSVAIDFKCPPSELVLRTGIGCLAVLPDLTKEIASTGNALQITQDPPAGTSLAPGTHLVQVSFVDIFGQPHLCRVFVSVSFGNGAGLQCPIDVVTNCASLTGQVVTFSPTVCNPAYTVKSDPPSGSLFPLGTTKVVVTATGANGQSENCTFTVTVNCPGIVTLTQPGGIPTIDWTGPAVFQHAPTPAGPWVTLPEVKPPYVIKVRESAEFFRVLQ